MVLSRHPGAPTLVRSPATYQPTYSYISNSLVPCTLDTPISINVGGKEVSISPDSFNLGRTSQDSDTCVAGAAADPTLTGSELVPCFPSKQS